MRKNKMTVADKKRAARKGLKRAEHAKKRAHYRKSNGGMFPTTQVYYSRMGGGRGESRLSGLFRAIAGLR